MLFFFLLVVLSLYKKERIMVEVSAVDRLETRRIRRNRTLRDVVRHGYVWDIYRDPGSWEI